MLHCNDVSHWLCKPSISPVYVSGENGSASQQASVLIILYLGTYQYAAHDFLQWSILFQACIYLDVFFLNNVKNPQFSRSYVQIRWLNNIASLKLNCHHFDAIFVVDCTKIVVWPTFAAGNCESVIKMSTFLYQWWEKFRHFLSRKCLSAWLHWYPIILLNPL